MVVKILSEFVLTKCAINEVLISYIAIGNKIKETSDIMKTIESDISVLIDSREGGVKMPFMYVAGSSGKGKTQLTFSLTRPTLFIPLGNCFSITC